jgi:hypothetical protein
MDCDIAMRPVPSVYAHWAIGACCGLTEDVSQFKGRHRKTYGAHGFPSFRDRDNGAITFDNSSSSDLIVTAQPPQPGKLG